MQPSNGFVVCTDCGTTKHREYVDHRPLKKSRYDEIISHNSEGKSLDHPDSLGSFLGKSGLATYNNRGQRLRSHQIRKYQRLSKYYQEPAKKEHNATHLRTIVAFKKIAQDLNLGKSLQQRSLYLYWKHVKLAVEKDKTITNHILLVALCLLYTIREAGSESPIRFSEVISTFAQKGHRVTNKNIFRLARELDFELVPKNRRSEDYIPRIAAKVRESKAIRQRLKYHILSVEEYEMKLIKITNEFLTLLDRGDRGGVQPFPFAVSVLYLADRCLARVMIKRPVLTQKLLAQAVGSAEFTIRDHIYRFLGELYQQHEEALVKFTSELL